MQLKNENLSCMLHGENAAFNFNFDMCVISISIQQIQIEWKML